MNTPAAALIWEVWGRHRKRLLAIIGIVAGFALVYPALCAWAGLDLNAPDILDDFVKKVDLAKNSGAATPGEVLRILYLLLLTAAPMLALVLTMFYVTWLFTFTEFDAKTRDPLTFPNRLFNFPVSTPFLYTLMTGGGMLGILILYSCWTFCARLPHWEIFGAFQNCFLWLTLLTLTQAIVWGLAGWPILRAFALAGLLWGFLAAPVLREWAGWPFILVTLFLQGAVVGFAGLQNMRNGQWQGRRLRWPFAGLFATGRLQGPLRFASMNNAQIWFEWRRIGRPLFLGIVALTFVPVLVLVLLRTAFGWAPLDTDAISGLSICLLGAPVLIYFLAAISPVRNDSALPLNRPITNGQIVTIRLKAMAISVALSWVAVLAALKMMAFLGDFNAVEQRLSSHFFIRVLFVSGLIFLTWRMTVTNLCFILTGRRRWSEFPIWVVTCASISGPFLFWLSNQPEYWQPFIRALPTILFILAMIKLTVAFVAFKISIQRKLIDRSSVAAYLGLWIVLVAAGITGIGIAWAIEPGSSPHWWPVGLGAVLAVPLARVGFCPIALSMFRHT